MEGKKCCALTTNVVFGRIDSHTKPVRIFVTAKPSVSRSALDYELLDDKVLDNCEHQEKRRRKAIMRQSKTTYENYDSHKELNLQQENQLPGVYKSI